MSNNKCLKLYVAGHNGMVGSALVRLLQKTKVEIITKNRSELDLLNQKKLEIFFYKSKN